MGHTHGTFMTDVYQLHHILHLLCCRTHCFGIPKSKPVFQANSYHLIADTSIASKASFLKDDVVVCWNSGVIILATRRQ